MSQIAAELLNEKTLTDDWVRHHSRTCMDIVEGLLYDTLRFAPGAAIGPLQSSFFTNVGPSSCKTYADTNLACPGMLSPPQAFLVKQICFVVHARISPKDLEMIQAKFCWELWLEDRQYGRGPLVAAGPVSSEMALSEPEKDTSSARVFDESSEIQAKAEFLGSMG